MNPGSRGRVVPCITAVYALTILFVLARPHLAEEQESETSAPVSNKISASADEEAPSPSVDEEEFYELIKLFSDTLDQVERNYVKEISRRELMEAAIRGVLEKLDQYSDYIPPDDLDGFRTGVENQFGGIGIRVEMVDDVLTVVTPLIGTPAYQAGIMAGDQITQIEGETTQGLSLQEAITRMKGKINTDVELTVRHAHNQQEETLKLTRKTVHIETVMGDRRNTDDSWNYMLDHESKIGYVRITSFSRRTHRDLKRALQRLTNEGMRGLILDLRFNPGGLLTSAIEVVDLFLAEGTIVSTRGRNMEDRSWSASKPGTFDNFEMVVLVNRYSASASEIVAAALQDHDRAIVIGERTWGKGSVQNVIELEGGRSALKLTTGGYHRPNGKNIHRFDGAGENDDWGVRPTDGYQVRLTPGETRRLLDFHSRRDIIASKLGQPADDEVDSESSFVDSQLQRALDYLNEEIARR